MLISKKNLAVVSQKFVSCLEQWLGRKGGKHADFALRSQKDSPLVLGLLLVFPLSFLSIWFAIHFPTDHLKLKFGFVIPWFSTMPSVAFVKKDNGNCDPFWIETSDVKSSHSMPWTPIKDQLKTLSRIDLCNLLPSSLPSVRKDTNKDKICDILIEHWTEMVKEATMSSSPFQNGARKGSHRRGYDADDGNGGGDDNPESDEPELGDPADYGMGDFYLTVKKTYNGNSFKNYLVNGNYNIAILKAMCSQKWKINPRHQRILHDGADVFDTSSLNELGIDHTSILKLMVRGQGGAGFIPFRKPHLKREDAITYMKEEQKKAFETKPELVVPDADLPDNFRQFLHGEKSKMDDILTLKTRLGGEFMKSALRQVSLETLATIKKLFESNRGKKGEKNLTIPEKIEKRTEKQSCWHGFSGQIPSMRLSRKTVPPRLFKWFANLSVGRWDMHSFVGRGATLKMHCCWHGFFRTNFINTIVPKNCAPKSCQSLQTLGRGTCIASLAGSETKGAELLARIFQDKFHQRDCPGKPVPKTCQTVSKR